MLLGNQSPEAYCKAKGCMRQEVDKNKQNDVLYIFGGVIRDTKREVTKRKSGSCFFPVSWIVRLHFYPFLSLRSDGKNRDAQPRGNIMFFFFFASTHMHIPSI
jgi:hypothetical protein